MSLQLAFWNIAPQLNKDLSRSLELFYWRIPIVSELGTPMLIDHDIDLLLRTAASKSEMDWLAVIAVGTIFPAQEHIVTLIKEAIEQVEEPVLVLGQLIDKKGRYCGIHEQLFIVNMNMYRKLGMPSFGNYDKKVRRLRNYTPGESIHDDYTPLTLDPAPGYEDYETWTCGWNFVHVSMEAGLPIFNLPHPLRIEKIYAYPEDESERLNKNLELLYQMEDMENYNQRRVLAYLFNKRFGFSPKWKGSSVQLLDREALIFLFNTEFLLPDAEWIRENRKDLDVFMGPCSGFLDVVSLYAHGFHNKTRVIYYDINEKSIDIKKRMLREFSGDLNELEDLFRQIIADNPYRRFHIGNFQKERARLLEVFGSEENFKKTWRALQELPKEFIPMNLISFSKNLLKHVKPTERILFAISDIFAGQNELTYGHSGINNRFWDMVYYCEKFPNLVLSGVNTEGWPFIEYPRFMDREEEYRGRGFRDQGGRAEL